MAGTSGYPPRVAVRESKGKARAEALEAVRSGDAGVVIGTHALFQEDVEFHRLALVIVDEQHRFGVHQRLALRKKGVEAPWHLTS